MASLFDGRGANCQVSDLFLECSKNVEFEAWSQQVQNILNGLRQLSLLSRQLPSEWQSPEPGLERQIENVCKMPTIDGLMVGEPPEPTPLLDVLAAERPLVLPTDNTDNTNLRTVFMALRSNREGLGNSTVRKVYGDDLMASVDAYQDYKEPRTPNELPKSLSTFVYHRLMAQQTVDEMSKRLFEKLSPDSQVSRFLGLVGLWPRPELCSLFRLLSRISRYPLVSSWQACLIALGEAVTITQRARRLVLAGEQRDMSAFFDEYENSGRKGWRSFEFPDWLLIELENDFLIRPIQARVALSMIRPLSSANSLIQLNMGEGKSSVIIPLAAVALADGKRMVRVVLLKSLSKQMSHTMTRRLGGLVGRKIYYMPFSRSTPVDDSVMGRIEKMQKECMSGKGILLAQPEHMLSFKLLGIEKLTSGHYKIASRLLASQRWLEQNSRDILDESDEILDVHFQLIYTLGTQRMMDGQPDRWKLTQEIFDLVDKHVSALQIIDQDQIELERRSPSSFPTVRLLSTAVGGTLLSMIAQDVVESQLPGLNLIHCQPRLKEVVSQFVQQYHVLEKGCAVMKEFFANEQTTMQKLLLIKGLIAHGILLFILRSKRWSVNYGLHPTRCLSAVLYRAKGVPASNAEFGHPDVSIALTCLTYYYSGLTDPQIRKCFELLQKSDDPSQEYSTWTSRCTQMPESLRTWGAVNLEDDSQCHNELFPALRFNKRIADYYLDAVVFPLEGKEFDEKLSTSGWDIPSCRGTEYITTGFSGTNDNRFLVPLTVLQQDLPELHHTSGKVLNYVTRPENLKYYYARDERVSKWLERNCFNS